MSLQEQLETIKKTLNDAAEAEVRGDFALASLLALQVLQLQPGHDEASAVLQRSQTALRLKRTGNASADGEAAATGPEDELPAVPGELIWTQKSEEKVSTIDLQRFIPLAAPPRVSFFSRIRRLSVPILVAGLLVGAAWFDYHRGAESLAPVSKVKGILPLVRKKPALPAPAHPVPVAPPAVAPRAPVTGTVALNIVPWAKIDSIVNLSDGKEVGRPGTVSPCMLTLPEGQYRFTVSHPNFGAIQFPILVKGGEVNTVQRSLVSDQDLEKELAANFGSVEPRMAPRRSPGTRMTAKRRYLAQQR